MKGYFIDKGIKGCTEYEGWIYICFDKIQVVINP